MKESKKCLHVIINGKLKMTWHTSYFYISIAFLGRLLKWKSNFTASLGVDLEGIKSKGKEKDFYWFVRSTSLSGDLLYWFIDLNSKRKQNKVSCSLVCLLNETHSRLDDQELQITKNSPQPRFVYNGNCIYSDTTNGNRLGKINITPPPDTVR